MKTPEWVTQFGLHFKRRSPVGRWVRKTFGHLKRQKPAPAPAPAPSPAPKPRPVPPLKGCDYVAGPTPAQLKAAGIKFVFRYLSTPGNPKNLTKAEAKALLAAGIEIGLVFETTANRALSGAAAGKADAKSAAAQAAALGVPATTAIYFAVDTGAAGSELKAVVAYIRAAAAVLGAARTGVYGGLGAVKACLDAKVCKFAWQTYAWSGTPTVWDMRAQVRQVANGQKIGGHSVDLDEALASFGAWKAA